MLIISGEYVDGVLYEKYVDELGDDFDDVMFYRVVKCMDKYNEIF